MFQVICSNTSFSASDNAKTPVYLRAAGVFNLTVAVSGVGYLNNTPTLSDPINRSV